LLKTLGSIHGRGVIHRDLKPKNILIHPATEETEITNFGISAILTHEHDEAYNPDFIKGSLALYVAGTDRKNEQGC